MDKTQVVTAKVEAIEFQVGEAFVNSDGRIVRISKVWFSDENPNYVYFTGNYMLPSRKFPNHKLDYSFRESELLDKVW